MSYLVAIEGNDGAGKSSLIKKISRYYKNQGFKVLVVRYNMSYVTLPAIKEGKKRGFAGDTNTLLHFLSITDQLDRFVNKKIEKGYIVIWDRYKYSVIARGFARGVSKTLLDYCYDHCPTPNATILLDISPEQSISRLGSDINYWEAGKDVYPHLSKEESFVKFQTKVRNKLREIIVQENNHKIVNAIQTKTEIFQECVHYLNIQFKSK